MVRPPTTSLLRVSSPSHAAPGMLASATDALFRDSRVATIVLFLPPALLLFTLFVVLPIARGRLVQRLQLERLRPADQLGRARQLPLRVRDRARSASRSATTS